MLLLFKLTYSIRYRDYLDQLCGLLYDLLRPHIIHSNHLETLAELCFILRVEMIDEHVNNNRIFNKHKYMIPFNKLFFLLAEKLGSFHRVVSQLLADVQERLVYRAHIYVQNDILGYKPGGGDLAYPEKLEMMKVSCSYKPIYH